MEPGNLRKQETERFSVKAEKLFLSMLPSKSLGKLPSYKNKLDSQKNMEVKSHTKLLKENNEQKSLLRDDKAETRKTCRQNRPKLRLSMR